MGADAIARFLANLLDRMSELANADLGAAYIGGGSDREGGLAAMHERPGAQQLAQRVRNDPGMLARLARVAERAMESDESGVVSERLVAADGLMYDSAATHEALGVPLVANGRTEGACVLLVPLARRDSSGLARTSLRLAADGFEAFLWSQRCLAEAERAAKLRETLELLDAAQRGPAAPAMAALFCDELRRRFACSRVSVGLVQGHDIRVVAVSGADTVERRSPAVESLEAAMEECADQDIEVVFPQPEGLAAADRRVVRAHGDLSQGFGPSAILSLPLRVDGDLVGVAVLERAADDPFPPGSIPLMRLVAEFIGPAVWTRRLADRGILRVVRDRIRDLGSAIVGPRHTLAKVVGILVLAVFAAMAFVPVPATISSEAETKADAMRSLTAPFQGYLEWVGFKPGDRVSEGDVVARMATTERQLQLAALDAQLAAARTERESQLARREVDAASVSEQRIRELEPQRAILARELERAEIRASIDGRLSGSDLEPFINAPISPDMPLGQIVGIDSVIVIKVGENNVDAVQQILARPADERGEADGTFAARARPDDRLPIRVLRINPQADAIAGGNVYLVEAQLVGDRPAWLRPGMTGRARIDNGWTTILYRVVDPLLDRARMAWWW
ncbi:MAG: GAF domain-containing protein [Planctomycetota bacterium]